jgi:hypothetical protein
MATVIRRPITEQHELLDQLERLATGDWRLATETFDGRVERNFVTALYTGRRC